MKTQQTFNFFFRSPYLMFNRLHFPDFLTIYNCVDFLCKHKYFIIIHSSEIRDLCLMKFSSSEKPHIFSRNRCHGFFQHRLIMFKKNSSLGGGADKMAQKIMKSVFVAIA